MSQSSVPQTVAAGATSQSTKTAADIQTWLVDYLADLLEIEPNTVKVSTQFERYGLDSAAVVGLSGDLEEWLGLELDPTLLYDYPTIETLAKHLAEECTKS